MHLIVLSYLNNVFVGSDGLDYKIMGQFFSGLAQSGNKDIIDFYSYNFLTIFI